MASEYRTFQDKDLGTALSLSINQSSGNRLRAHADYVHAVSPPLTKKESRRCRSKAFLLDGRPVPLPHSKGTNIDNSMCPLCSTEMAPFTRLHFACCGGCICALCAKIRQRRSQQVQRDDLLANIREQCPLCCSKEPSNPDQLFRVLLKFASDCKILTAADKHVKQSNFDASSKRVFNKDNENAWAQIRVGDCYMEGTGVELCFQNAVVWYDRAAAQGHPEALFKMGVMYENGWGVKRSLSRAVSWFQRAVKQDHNEARAHLLRLRRIRRRMGKLEPKGGGRHF